MDNNILQEPFRSAFLNGASIDYKVDGNENDHTYVKKLGYITEMWNDCTYHAKGLSAFNLSSYGDWGTFFTNWSDDVQKQMFLDMVSKNIIKLWRIRYYKKSDNVVTTYDYSTERGWSKHTDNGWVVAENPFER